MPLSSRLRPSSEQIAKIAATYAAHRPAVQRTLTAGFVVYVLSTTYQSLFSRAPPAHTLGKGKGKGKAADQSADGKKPPRVAVRIRT